MANVRIFGYAGIVQIDKLLVKQYTAAGVFMRDEPYLWSQKIALNGATPVVTAVQANDRATMVVIEVDDNTAVRYELNPNGPSASNARNASTNSPKLVGENVFKWFGGATLSFVDAASV